MGKPRISHHLNGSSDGVVHRLGTTGCHGECNDHDRIVSGLRGRVSVLPKAAVGRVSSAVW